MKVSGFTIIRNGLKYDFPFLESISSLLPLVDEFIINVGKSDDKTREAIERLDDPKIKIIESDWQWENPQKQKGGQILSEQTNLALDQCTGDWCFYLQADEVLHEADYGILQESFKRYLDDKSVEALLFDWVHFYGSYDVYQNTRSAYRREVRAFKKSSGARSIGDAQSFRAGDRKLKAVRTGARVFHYGWVRSPQKMKEKTVFMDQLYHGASPGDQPHTGDNYRYKRFWGLDLYRGTHPEVMRLRINRKGWNWDFEKSQFVWKWKDSKKVVLDTFEKLTGNRLFEYRSYELVRDDSNELKDFKQEEIKASLILATYNMPKHLELVFAGLMNQSTDEYEIILCDDGSGEETRKVVNRFATQSPVPFFHLWQDDNGFRKSRILNEGIRKARGPILVFLDGDCVPHKDFIRDHIEFTEPGYYLAGRRVELGPEFSKTLSPKKIEEGLLDGPSFELLKSCLNKDSEHFQRTLRVKNPLMRKIMKLNRVDDLKGCNYSVPKSAMLAINGYDEAYEGYGREDTDIEIRLQNFGLKIKSLKGAGLQYHVWHPRRDFTPENDIRLEKLKVSGNYLPERGLRSEL